MQRGRVGLRGAAAVELALMAPFLFLLIVGGIDMARMASDGATVSAEARAGLRQIIVSATSTPGIDIRSEADPTVANSTAVWGIAGHTKTDACDTGVLTSPCGDTPGGCATGSAFWTAGVTHCFAVRTCNAAAPSGSPPVPLCASPGAWGTRVAAGHAAATNVMEVLVVELYPPIAGDLNPFTTTITATGTKAIIIQEPMFGALAY